jgi:hypothetical protein
MTLFNRAVLKKVLLKDQHNDTLLYAPSMVATLRKLSLSQKKLSLSRLKFENAVVRIAVDTSEVVNLSFIVDALRKPPDSTRTETWTVSFKAIDFSGSRFLFQQQDNSPVKSYGINFSDLELGNMDLNIHGFMVAMDTIRFNVDHLSFLDRSGFYLDHLEALVFISGEFFLWRNVSFRTRESQVTADRLDFRFNSWQDFGEGDFFTKVGLQYNFKPSRVYTGDLSYFSDVFKGFNTSVRMSGDLHGSISSFKGDDVILEYGRNTRFSGSFDLIGLPDFQETYMYFDIGNLTTSVADIESIQIPGKPGNTIDLGENLAELGNITCHGNYAGYYNDFVTYGAFMTDLGKITSDLSIRPDAEENVHFKGEISTKGFDLGRLRNLEHLAGKLSMKGNVEGISYHGGELSARMDGSISLIELNGYPYQNIILEGDLSDRKFDGSFSIADPNLKMEFFGKIDLTDSLPVFDFTANVDKAMLYPLNITTSDPSYNVSCYLRANFTGANLNDFDGEIKLVNSLFRKQDKQIQIYDFNLFAHHRPDTNRMILRSDLLDAEITGYYEFEDLGVATGQILVHHLPSFRNIVKTGDQSVTSRNNFRYSVNFKNTFPITDFFYPDVEIARNSTISGNYYPAGNELSLVADFPGLRWKNSEFEGLELNLESSDSMAQVETNCRLAVQGERIHLENLSLDAWAMRDKFGYSVNWDNKNPYQVTLGTISGQAAFQFRENNTIPLIDLQFDPGEVVIRDTSWYLAPAHILVDSSRIRFEKFAINHGKQALQINGTISENPADKLDLLFSNLDLAQLNQAFKGMELSGIANGFSTISGVYDNLVFLSDLRIDSLGINHEILGNTLIQTRWIDPEQKIQVDVQAMRGQLVTLELKGGYFPDSRKIDFDIALNKLKIKIFQPYLSTLVSGLDGIASGDLKLTGTLDKPVMNGEVGIQKTSFLVDYLQTEYSLSDRARIRDNTVYLSNVEVYDDKGSRAILNGTIQTGYLNTLVFDLNLVADNFNFLNTREVDNPLFYGEAIGSGQVGVTGTPGNIRLFISARTNRGTHMFIPLNQESDITENNFITFVRPDMAAPEEEPQQKKSPEEWTLVLDLRLEVTEDATTEIIFDPKVGDIMQVQGHGNIQFSIDPQNGFRMFGDYIIEDGDYLFTLQGVINKRLKIQRGGSIEWNGDPTSAMISVRAIYYNIKTSPAVLVPDPPDYLKARMLVEPQMILEGNLMNPTISYDIVLPNAEEETRNVVRNAIATEEELTKQFLSLLVMNSFSSVAISTGGSARGTGAGMAGVTASELLSNQLSNWLSQISDDFDIGVNYRPGDEISSDQVEVALSTQIFDERVSIHTDVGYTPGGNTASAKEDATNVMGDFDVEVKLTDNGKLRLKAFNRYNQDRLYATAPYTQGVGLMYREDFNSFRELGKRYSDAITGKNRKKKKAERNARKENAEGTENDETSNDSGVPDDQLPEPE